MYFNKYVGDIVAPMKWLEARTECQLCIWEST